MPLTELIRQLDSPPPNSVIAAANSLTYRDFLTVCLIVDHPSLFGDNWIYIHDPEVKVGDANRYASSAKRSA